MAEEFSVKFPSESLVSACEPCASLRTSSVNFAKESRVRRKPKSPKRAVEVNLFSAFVGHPTMVKLQIGLLMRPLGQRPAESHKL